MRLREHPAIGEGRTDILAADPRQLSIIENYNVRDLTTPEARAELDELKAQVKEHGVKTALVVRFDGANIWIIEGHRRHKVALELIAEHEASGGAEGRNIEFVPIKAEAPGTNDVDRDFSLETSNSGSRLKPLELANLIYRLMNQRGLSIEAVAKGLGRSVAVCRNHLETRAMSEPIKEHVRKGDISATLARNIAKGVPPEEAEKLIRENLEENKRIKGTDKVRVTPKSIRRDKPKPQAPVASLQVPQTSPAEPKPDMVEMGKALQEVADDPEWNPNTPQHAASAETYLQQIDDAARTIRTEADQSEKQTLIVALRNLAAEVHKQIKEIEFDNPNWKLGGLIEVVGKADQVLKLYGALEGAAEETRESVEA